MTKMVKKKKAYSFDISHVTTPLSTWLSTANQHLKVKLTFQSYLNTHQISVCRLCALVPLHHPAARAAGSKWAEPSALSGQVTGVIETDGGDGEKKTDPGVFPQ